MNNSNRIFSPWKEIETLTQPLTEGEKKLVEFLDTTLPKDNCFSFETTLPKDNNFSFENRKRLIEYNGWVNFCSTLSQRQSP